MSHNSINRGEAHRSPVDARELIERWMNGRSPSAQGIGNSLGERARWTVSRSGTGTGNQHRMR